MKKNFYFIEHCMLHYSSLSAIKHISFKKKSKCETEKSYKN